MNNWRERCDTFFFQLAGKIYRRAALVLLLIAVVLAALGSQLPKLRMDTAVESFLAPDDPAILRYEAFKSRFGNDQMILLVIETDDIFQADFLSWLRQLELELEALSYVDEADSLLSPRHIYGEDDSLIVEDLGDPLPQSAEEIETFKHKALSNPLYRDVLLSKSGHITQVIVHPLAFFQSGHSEGVPQFAAVGEPQLATTLEAIRQIIQRETRDNRQIHMTGSPTVSNVLATALIQDMQRFGLALGLIIITVLYLLFRRVSGVILPLLVVFSALISTVALMAGSGQPLQLPTGILPSFLVSVGIGDSVHLLTRFYTNLDRGADKLSALQEAMGHTGLAMLLTTLTTAAGLLSFSTSDIFPIANLGIFAAAGVCLAFVFTLLLLPALIRLLPLQSRQAQPQQSQSGLIQRIINGALHLSLTKPKSVVIAGLGLLGLALLLAAQLRFSHNPIVWLPENYPLRIATELNNREMAGSIAVEVLADTGKPEGVKTHAHMAALEELAESLSHYQNERLAVGKVISVSDMLKETNRALHDGQEQAYRVPADDALLVQELFLLEMSGAEDLFERIDSDYQTSRTTVMVPWMDALNYKGLSEDIEALFRQKLGDGVDITTTGMIPIMGRTLSEVIRSTGISYLIAFTVIAFMMMLLMGSWRLGLLSMLPNLLPIIVVMGLLKLIDGPLDMFTMLIGSIAIGLAVDDTVHFMHHYSNYRLKGYAPEQAIEKTLRNSGPAMLITSLVLSCGFFVYILSELHSVTNFGLLTGLCIVLAVVADFLLAPALMLLVERRRNPVQKL